MIQSLIQLIKEPIMKFLPLVIYAPALALYLIGMESQAAIAFIGIFIAQMIYAYQEEIRANKTVMAFLEKYLP